MRRSPRVKLDAIRDTAARHNFKVLEDTVLQHAAILAKAIQLGTNPAANPTPTSNPGGPGGDPSSNPLPSPTLGTLLRGTAGGQWENLGLGTSGQVLTVSSGNANWASTSALGVAILSANNVFTGDNTFQGLTTFDDIVTMNINNGPPVFSGDLSAGGTFCSVYDTDSAFTMEFLLSSAPTGSLTFPAAGGTVVTTTATQTLTNKTLTLAAVGTSLRSDTSSSGASFADTNTTTKRLRFVLSGATGNNAISVTGNAQTYALGSLGGNAAIASNTPSANQVLRFSATQEAWGTIDHNYMATRVRTAWYSFGAFYDPGTGGPGFDGTVGSAPASQAAYHALPAVGGSPIAGYIHVPSDYESGATWKLYWTTNNTDLNTVSFQVALHVIGSGTALNATATSSVTTNGTPSGTANQVVITTLSNSLTVAGGNVIRVCIQRDGADANGDAAYALGIMLEYTADM